MALETNPDQAFLGPTDEDLDSMAFTGTQPQFGMGAATPGGNFGLPGDDPSRVSDGREAGFTGVSESLFDRIRARAAEQQQQSQSQPSPAIPPPKEPMPAPASQQPSSEPTMELERANPFDAAVAGATSGANNNNNKNNNSNKNNNNETTYSFAATAGENFSAAAPHVPSYGPSRNDPHYVAASSDPQYPTSLQDKATRALAQTGDTVRSIFGAGVSGAQAIGALAQEKMAGRGGQGERSYNNNFLIREDTMEQTDAYAMNQRPPSAVNSAGMAAEPQTGALAGQYSMLSYGKTFCEDLVVFVTQLPPWGKGIVAVVLGYVLYLIIGAF